MAKGEKGRKGRDDKRLEREICHLGSSLSKPFKTFSRYRLAVLQRFRHRIRALFFAIAFFGHTLYTFYVFLAVAWWLLKSRPATES